MTTTPAEALTDAELIAGTRDGDTASYDELYRRHVDDVRRIARIVTDDPDEAEDVVAEAFTRLLAQLQGGGGPQEQLTPYLRTVVRRLAIDRYRASGREGLLADTTVLDVPSEPDDSPDRMTDRELVRRAYETLPERWQEVLWHTEIVGRSPAALASVLGTSPNAVAALAYRAREGLRQAYLSVHLSSSIADECRPYVPKLAAYVRGTLSPGEDRWVADHLEVCEGCRERRDELMLLVSDLRGVLWPALLTPVAVGGGGMAAAGAVSSGMGRWVAKIPKPRSRGQAVAASVSVVAAAAVVAAAIAIGNSDDRSAESPSPPSAPRTSEPLSPRASGTPTPTTSTTVTASPVPEPSVPPVAGLIPSEPRSQGTVEPTAVPVTDTTVESDGGPKWCDALPEERPNDRLPPPCRR